jgi:hypothetical protein
MNLARQMAPVDQRRLALQTGMDANGYRAEFIRMVELAETLTR